MISFSTSGCRIRSSAVSANEKTFNERVEKFFALIYPKAFEMGGQVSGEHGIGLGKKSYLKQSAGERNVALMQGIKQVFDPEMILNPGKICFP